MCYRGNFFPLNMFRYKKVKGLNCVFIEASKEKSKLGDSYRAEWQFSASEVHLDSYITNKTTAGQYKLQITLASSSSENLV